MPVFTNTISQQNQASSSYAVYYPAPGYLSQYRTMGDQFNRTTLNPTNAIPIYSASHSSGTGTATILNGTVLQLSTTTSSGDNEDVLLSELFLSRGSSFVDPRTILSCDIIFSLAGTGNQKMFVGISQITALTGIPTTTNTMGLQLDTSDSVNFKFTVADGSLQTKTDTLIAADTAFYRLNILYNGNNSNTLTLYSSVNNFNTILSTSTSTTTPNLAPAASSGLHFYIETATTSAKSLKIQEWAVTCQ